MATKQTLALDQRLGQYLTQQQLRYVKLLECNAQELEEAVDRELEDNPALEADSPEPTPTPVPERYTPRRAYSQEPETYEFTPPDASESLYDSLYRQLPEKSLSPDVEEAARFIIGSLDPNGYLRRPIPNLLNDMAFGQGIEVTEEEAREALRAV